MHALACGVCALEPRGIYCPRKRKAAVVHAVGFGNTSVGIRQEASDPLVDSLWVNGYRGRPTCAQVKTRLPSDTRVQATQVHFPSTVTPSGEFMEPKDPAQPLSQRRGLKKLVPQLTTVWPCSIWSAGQPMLPYEQYRY